MIPFKNSLALLKIVLAIYFLIGWWNSDRVTYVTTHKVAWKNEKKIAIIFCLQQAN